MFILFRPVVDPDDFVSMFQKYIDQVRIKLTILFPFYELKGVFDRPCFFIGTNRSQRIKNIRYADDSAELRDFQPRSPRG